MNVTVCYKLVVLILLSIYAIYFVYYICLLLRRVNWIQQSSGYLFHEL